jgi:hypothetical protein
LKKQAEALDLKHAHVACGVCLEVLCSYNALVIGMEDCNEFIVMMQGIFGTVSYINVGDPALADNPFVAHFLATTQMQPDMWAVCVNKHIIGWQTAGKCYVDSKSPVLVKYPGNETEPWSISLIRNNFSLLKKRNDEYVRKTRASLNQLVCNICSQIRFANE